MIDTFAATEKVLSAFPGHRKSGQGWSAHCPNKAMHKNGDRSQSLSISVSPDGNILLYCHVCGKDRNNDIVKAAGLEWADLFPGDTKHDRNGKAKPPPKSPPDGKAHHSADVAILNMGVFLSKQLGYDVGAHTDQWPYHDANGNEVGMVVRWEPPGKFDKDGKQEKVIRPLRRDEDGWRCKGMDDPQPLYQLHQLKSADTVYVLEGEKCADAAWSIGLIATTSIGGAKRAAFSNWTSLAGKNVVVIRDNDQPGLDYVNDVKKELLSLPTPARVRLFEIPGLKEKGDLADWIAQHDATEPDALRQLLLSTLREIEDPKQPQTTGYRPEPTDSKDFFAADFRPSWLVTKLIAAHQPLILGGPQKTLKTSICIDIAISLASGTPVLGTFAVPRPVKVAVISGESGPFALQSIAKRVCAAKGISTDVLTGMLSWQFRLPQLAIAEQLDALRQWLLRDKPDVLIVEPLYLSLLAGSNVRAENLFEMGPLLLKVKEVCEEAGVTPILAHHTGKPAARSFESLDLPDLAYSGIGEFARQWIMINRREKYEPGTGHHKLHLSLGGSLGHNGLWAIDIDEGQIEEDFSGRRWEVTVTLGTEAKRSEKDVKEEKKKLETLEKDTADDNKLMRVIDELAKKYGGIAPYSQASDIAGLNTKNMNRAVARLASLIEEHPVNVAIGSNATRNVRGLRRIPEKEPSGPIGPSGPEGISEIGPNGTDHSDWTPPPKGGESEVQMVQVPNATKEKKKQKSPNGRKPKSKTKKSKPTKKTP